MKIIALLAAGVLGLTGVATAAPADAQRYGWNDGYRDGPRADRGFRGDRFDRGLRGDRFDRGFRGNRGGYYAPRRGFNAGRGYGRPRVVCRIQRGWYGPERVCVRRFR